MARRTAVYEIVDSGSREVPSRHRTRQAAVDTWRTRFGGRRVRIERRGVPDEHMLVAEGIWHESARGT